MQAAQPQTAPRQQQQQQQQPPPPPPQPMSNHHHHHHHHHHPPQPLTCTGPPSVGKGPRNQQQPAFNSTAVQYGPPPVAPILHHPAGHSPPPPPGWQQHKASPAGKVPRDPIHERLMKKAKSRQQQQQQQQSLQQSSSSQHSTPATSPAKRGVKGKAISRRAVDIIGNPNMPCLDCHGRLTLTKYIVHVHVHVHRTLTISSLSLSLSLLLQSLCPITRTNIDSLDQPFPWSPLRWPLRRPRRPDP